VVGSTHFFLTALPRPPRLFWCKLHPAILRVRLTRRLKSTLGSGLCV